MPSSSVSYRVFIDGQNVDQKLYDMIDTIVVQQTFDKATEARVELEMCANDRGQWSGPTDSYARAWRRLRVEVSNLSTGWTALIDGPIVEWDAHMSGEPGRSTMTLVAHDDSVYLNKKTNAHVFEGRTVKEVAESLLKEPPAIKDTDVDLIPDPPPSRLQQLAWLGTEMDLLRELARPYDMHVFVRPGNRPGTSIGCVKKIDVTRKPTLPSLVLVGAKRNIDEFHVRNEAAKAGRRAAAQLDVGNLTINKYESSWSDVDLLGDGSATDDNSELSREHLAPDVASFHQIDQAARAGQQRSSWTVMGSGSLRGACYAGVLTPYEVVSVSGANEKLCTTFAIREVTHTLDRSSYRQDFKVETNALAKVGWMGIGVPPEIC